ncbi:MAG: DUF3624 family protein [Bacteroidota bacterium]
MHSGQRKKMGCNNCNQNVLGITNAKEKLGRCTYCIVSAIIGTGISWGVYYFLNNRNGDIVVLIVASIFSFLLLSHLFAFFYRKRKK